MKQLIVMAASIMLGLYIFNIIAGGQDESIFSIVKEVWTHEIEARNMEEFPGGAQ